MLSIFVRVDSLVALHVASVNAWDILYNGQCKDDENEQTWLYLSTGSKVFLTIVNGIELSINEKEMSDDTVLLTESVLNNYPCKITAISEYLSKEKSIVACYGNISRKEIAEKLHEPQIRIDKDGGVLSYCNHELDADHIIVLSLPVF